MRFRICFEWLEDFESDGTLRIVGLETDEPDDVKDIYEKPYLTCPDYTLWALDPESNKKYKIVVEDYEILDIWEVEELPGWLR